MLPSYLMPWQEVAGDLYDEVKSLSKGYASFDYDQVRPQESTAHSDPPKGAAATKGGSPGPPIKPGAETNQQDQGPPLTVGTVGTSPCSPHLTSPHLTVGTSPRSTSHGYSGPRRPRGLFPMCGV